ncbi:response regulator transcription factor [Microaerobacter geothermalis]|uniref:response regulator transcription factor n=1 Tax=Microaerobacter geothermalis TaxID=674972 RepID=UPI001F40FE18|nr:response regulator transcription factor [Microaerobacter geothermalis]MCF6094834.1 response regulator transcription factor [Microaerobacter geothermalis]
MESFKILIVEDEKQIVRFLELELKHEGYIVDAAFDGREGLKKAEENKYDLVLLDIMLPGLNGMEVCRRIRQFSNLPVIMLTAKDDVTEKVMGLDIGADDYITKPFAIEELLARIRVALRRKRDGINLSENLQIADLRMNLSKRQVSRTGKLIELTKREYDLLDIHAADAAPSDDENKQYAI